MQSADGTVEDSFPLYYKPPRLSMRRLQPAAQPVTDSNLDMVATSVKAAGTEASAAIRAGMRERFPDSQLLSALGMVQPRYHERPVPADRFSKDLTALGDQYCVSRRLSDGTLVPPLLDRHALLHQAIAFRTAMQRLVPEYLPSRARASGASSSGTAGSSSSAGAGAAASEGSEGNATVRLWERILSQPALAGTPRVLQAGAAGHVNPHWQRGQRAPVQQDELCEEQEPQPPGRAASE